MEPFDDDVLWMGRDPFALGAALAPTALGTAIMASGLPDALALGASVAWLGLGIASYVWARNPTGFQRAVRLRVDAEGVYVDGSLWARRAALAKARLQPSASTSPMVRLRRKRGGSLGFAVRDLGRARELLAAVGGEPVRSVAVEWAYARPFGEPRRFAPAAALLALALVAGRFLGTDMPGALSLAVLALVVFFGALAVPTRVIVGSDGVLLRWLGTQRFIAWARVLSIESFAGGVALALDRGEWVTLRLPATHERYAPEGAAVVERMRAAWTASGGDTGDDGLAPWLGQRPNGTHAWVRAAREAAAPCADYRSARVPGPHLWRLVENPRADREVRTGAAVALVSDLDEPGRLRLRAVAEACVEPRLRSALDLLSTDAAAQATDETLVHALDALEWEGSCELTER
jgi:hypothetical protein